MRIQRDAHGKIFAFLAVLVTFIATVWLYRLLQDHGINPALFVYVLWIVSAVLLRHHTFAFKKISVPISTKAVVQSIALWLVLLVIIDASLPHAEYTFIISRGIWGNMSFIITFVMLAVWPFAFLWYGCRKFSLTLKDMGLRMTSMPSMVIWAAIAASPVLVKLFWYGDWHDDISWEEPLLVLSFFSNTMQGSAAALVEEIIFRGLFFTIFRSRMGTTSAWVLQALLFGLSHIALNPNLQSIGALDAMGAGLVFGAAVLGSGSLYPGIFAHVLTNILAMFLQLNFPGSSM